MKRNFETEEALMPVATLPGQPREEEDDDLEDVSYDEDQDDDDLDLDDEDDFEDFEEEDEL